MEDTYINTTESAGSEYGYDAGIEYGYDGGIGTQEPDQPIGYDAGIEYGYDGGIGTPEPDQPIGYDAGIGDPVLDPPTMNQDQQQYSSIEPLEPLAPAMNQEPPQHHVMGSSVQNSMRMNQKPPPQAMWMNQKPPQHGQQPQAMRMNQKPSQHAMGMNQKPPPQAMGMNQKPPQHDQQPVMGSPLQQNIHLLSGQHQRSPVDMARIGKPWSSGLFDCGKNETNATMTAFFPCVTFGQIAEILDEGETTCTLGSFMYIAMAPALLTCWILGSNYRAKLRKRYNLVEAPAEDWTVHLFCSCCALCQEYRELQNQGIDPSLGWMGYLAQQQQTITTPPNGQFMNQ